MAGVRPIAESIHDPNVDAGQGAKCLVVEAVRIRRVGETAEAKTPALASPMLLPPSAERQAGGGEFAGFKRVRG
jgi:hypothetical protein